MSNLTDFFPSGGGGGLTPKFQEFNASGTFTPSQALIDAGGYIELFLVAGGGRDSYRPNGGEVLMKKMYLTSVSSCSVTIGAGGVSNGNNGGNSVFSGSSAGGSDVTALGGVTNSNGQDYRLSVGMGSSRNNGAFGQGTFGYGAGGGYYDENGITKAKTNSGQASTYDIGGSGYCLIKWYE